MPGEHQTFRPSRPIPTFAIFKVIFITMRTIIEYMQLCHIHFYQKIARKKVARVNAA